MNLRVTKAGFSLFNNALEVIMKLGLKKQRKEGKMTGKRGQNEQNGREE